MVGCFVPYCNHDSKTSSSGSSSSSNWTGSLLLLRVSKNRELLSWSIGYVIISSIPTTPAWLLTRPAVNFTLHCSDKSNTPPEIFKHRFYELCHEFKNYYRIFTDGSKKGNRVAAAVVHRDNTKVFDYLMQQAFSELNYMPFSLR